MVDKISQKSAHNPKLTSPGSLRFNAKQNYWKKCLATKVLFNNVTVQIDGVSADVRVRSPTRVGSCRGVRRVSELGLQVLFIFSCALAGAWCRRGSVQFYNETAENLRSFCVEPCKMSNSSPMGKRQPPRQLVSCFCRCNSH